MERTPVPITAISWGRIEVTLDGRTYFFKDCKIGPDGASEWDWRLTGTHHVPGTQPADVLELLEAGVEELVLSRGMQLALQTAPATEELLRARGIPYHVEETARAVALFNRLWQQGRKVGGVFHSTC
jgi:hypothetical protein